MPIQNHVVFDDLMKLAPGAGAKKSRQVPPAMTDGNCLIAKDRSQCDSKHPRCSACATAGTQCDQEDRHRQTLTPRGYTERVEQQLAQCEALLRHRIQGFDLGSLDEILAREGIDPNIPLPKQSASFQFSSSPRLSASPGDTPAKAYPYPQQHMMPHGYPVPLPYNAAGGPYPLSLQMQGPYGPHLHPAFPHHQFHSTAAPARPPDIKGQDPQDNDMSTQLVGASCFLKRPST